jgi:hypothetical protein
MGGHWVENPPQRKTRVAYTLAEKIEKKSIAAKQVHKVLRQHPNIDFPPVPLGLTPENVVRFTMSCVAQYLSPVKLEGEDNDFQCEDVARAIRMKLTPEIVDMVKLAILEGKAKVKI